MLAIHLILNQSDTCRFRSAKRRSYLNGQKPASQNGHSLKEYLLHVLPGWYDLDSRQ